MVFISLTVSYIVSIIAGLIILIWPKSLNYTIAAWLLFHGLLGVISSILV